MVCKKTVSKGLKKSEISTYLLARLGWFCPVASEPVKPYFTRFLRVLTFCLDASKIVIFCENGVVNGVVKWPGEMGRGMKNKGIAKSREI